MANVLTDVARVCNGPSKYRVASSGSGYMKIRKAIGAHAHRATPQPPQSSATPPSAGTNEYMSIVMIRYRAMTRRTPTLAASSSIPASRADHVTVWIGFRHQKSIATAKSGTSQPWEYCALTQAAFAFRRPGQ